MSISVDYFDESKSGLKPISRVYSRFLRQSEQYFKNKKDIYEKEGENTTELNKDGFEIIANETFLQHHLCFFSFYFILFYFFFFLFFFFPSFIILFLSFCFFHQFFHLIFSYLYISYAKTYILGI
jgi:hypothetical protein